MIQNYLKIALRNLKKNKMFSFINIIGFAFAISICLGISAYLLHEYSFDKYHKNAQQIYRLNDAKNNSSRIDYRVKNIILENYPEIDNACLSLPRTWQTPVTVDGKGFFLGGLLSADNAFFEMFSVPFVYGDENNPLPDLHSVILTTSAAKKLYGEENVLGRELELEHKHSLIVTGVIKDFPDNSSSQPEMIVNAENDDFKFSFSCMDGNDKSTYRWPFEIFIQINEHADAGELVNKINSHADILAPYEEQISLTALPDLHLHDTFYGGGRNLGNPGLLNLLISIGLIILTLAIINYINLTTAQQQKRYKEVGVKKSIGARRKDIILQFLTESILITFLALFIAFVFLWQSMPVYRTIFFDEFSLSPLLHHWLTILLAVMCIGLISGIGNSVLFASLHPIKALKGKTTASKEKNISFRSGLVIFQFMVSIVLIFCIIIMQQQIRFVKHNNPGFNEAQLLKLKLPGIQQQDRNAALQLINTFRQFSAIENVSMTRGVPGEINMTMGSGINGKDKYVSIMYADYNLMPTFDMQLVKGRAPELQDAGTTCLINEAAFKYFEWTDLKDKRFNNGRRGGFEVVGVVKDFHYSSLRTSIEPMCILFEQFPYPSHLSIRIAAGQVGNALPFIQKTWHELLPQYPLDYEFYDSWLDAMYKEDEKLGTTIGLFAALAIVISCLGILGMAISSTQKRTKEIGIRKVLGASFSELLVILASNFSKWVLLANVFAWPVAWYAMNKWLQNFAYKIDITVWPFLLAGLAALSIAMLTVSFQTIKAATANPVEALRYE